MTNIDDRLVRPALSPRQRQRARGRRVAPYARMTRRSRARRKTPGSNPGLSFFTGRTDHEAFARRFVRFRRFRRLGGAATRGPDVCWEPGGLSRAEKTLARVTGRSLFERWSLLPSGDLVMRALDLMTHREPDKKSGAEDAKPAVPN
jgi:hypothetical protein